jgi:Uma2 family endonuclease
MSVISSPINPGLPSLPPVPSDQLYETIDGERREVPHMGALAGFMASMLMAHLNSFALPQKLGIAVCEVLFRLRASPLLERRPDLAFVAYDRLPNPILPDEDPRVWEVVPNLAAEVVSPTNTFDEILDKIRDYFANGVQLVWVIHPRHRLAYVYQSPTQNRILQETDDLEGGNVLPGFRVTIRDLFAPLTKP